MRILFGDNEAYLEKHRTAARTRPKEEQKLGPDFYRLEHSKPLFNNNGILTIHNIYNYHTLLSVCKILKFHSPIAIYSLFKTSKRKETLLITSQQVGPFVHNGSSLWNIFRRLPEGSEVRDFSQSIVYVKSQIKKLVYRRQKLGDVDEWHSKINFSIEDL